MHNFPEKVSFIWSVADLLRGDYKAFEYGHVILPLLVLRRLDQVLADSREAVWKVDAKYPAEKTPEALRHQMLLKASGPDFYNTSKLDFAALCADAEQVAANLEAYVAGFSQNVRDIMESFRFSEQIERLSKSGLLYLVVQKFEQLDVHPKRVSNLEMGYVFEELIRKFSEQSNETAGEHFTPREVIRLMVHILFAEDDDVLTKPGVVRTLYDPACGTGGMLSVAQEYLHEHNPKATLTTFGQELNPESYAICKADMLIKGQEADNIKYGNSFSDDGLPELQVDYLISNPPFGVDWSKAQDAVRSEHEKLGHAGRFGPGLPRKNDGSLLFLLHMLSKGKPAPKAGAKDGGSRLAIVFNGSPLFTGAAGSGESEIRRWILENDWLEAIVALPDQLFYNTGISTYVWLLSNRKSPARRGKVQLINGVSYFQKMRKSLGNKRKELSEEQIQELTRIYSHCEVGPDSKLFDTEDFGFHRITVERPLRLNFQVSAERMERLEQEKAWQKLVLPKKGNPNAVCEGEELQTEILDVLQGMDGEEIYLSKSEFEKELKAAFKEAELKLGAPLMKSILNALSERDEDAEIVITKGKPEPDPELRDYENVPLKEDIGEYMEREVLPHVPDAWVDESKTKLGYEIPFTRHFYTYQPPRDLQTISDEIRTLDTQIRRLLESVL
ncbi:MAG: restriction endonuclease subunit M [Planctomycetota bacterium]|nr:MAG: restriction endonuclease subunit M [Planctomycetota bacterium]